MKLNIYIASFLLLLSISISAQKKTDANVFGHVVEKSTGEHLPFHNIVIKGTTIGITTDATGHYFLKNLPEGDYTIVASGVGYKTIEKKISLHSGRSLEVNFDVEQDVFQLNSVVVSANRNETNRKEASSIVNVISPMLFENTNAVCLAQGLNFQPGLRVETNCQNCGFSQVRINGLDGPYSQLLIDSRPIFSSLAGIYGLEQIPTNMIERVEVIRGGGSALFGSSAIGGVINIITKEPVVNSVTLTNTTNLIGGKSTDINTSFNASVVSDDFKTGVMFFGTSRQRNPFDYDGDGFTELAKINMKNVGFRGFYKPSHFTKLSLEYHNIGEFRRGGNKFELPAHKTDITEQVDHNINTASVKYDLFSSDYKHRFSIYTSAQAIDRESYYGAQQNPDAYGNTTNRTLVSGAQYTYSADTLVFMPAELTVGSEYTLDNISDVMPAYQRIFNQHINTASLFAQNEWTNTKLSLLVGGRLDKHNLIKNPVFSPRFNMRYTPADWISMRSSFSTGFRAPQSFDEDLHVSILGGEVALVELVDDLKMERSRSYSASVDLYKNFGKVETNLLVEGFYTRLDNVFVLEDAGKDEFDNLIFEKRNGSGAVVKGVNLEGRVVPAPKIQFQFGLTLQTSEYIEPESWSSNENIPPQKKMFRTPNQYGYMTLNYHVSKPMLLSLSGTYTGSMLVQHYAGYITEDREVATPRFLDINAKLSHDFKINGSAVLQLNGGVQNIFNSYQKDFDQGEFRDAGYIYGPSLPRTFFVGCKISI